MKYERFLFLIFPVLVFFFVFSACRNNSEENQSKKLENSASAISYSKIEDVDFKNFSYFYGEDDKYSFTLTNGEKPYGKVEDSAFWLRNIQYADLTNDGENEAIINVLAGKPVSQASLIYVYSLENKQPKKLWEIYSGTYANGGLKEVYVKENDLVIEFFGNTKFIEETNEFDFPNINKYPQANCCPSNFTRFYFDWNGEKFVLKEKPKSFPYDWKNLKHENLRPINEY